MNWSRIRWDLMRRIFSWRRLTSILIAFCWSWEAFFRNCNRSMAQILPKLNDSLHFTHITFQTPNKRSITLCLCPIYDIYLLRMKSSRLNRQSGTQFLQTPHSNRQRMRQKQKLSQDIKAKYIQELEQRNRKLKYEIIKINQMLDEQKDKPPAKREYKLIPTESSADVIKKELENVYKQIKNYEREINSLESKQAGGLITDKMSRLENILKEKTAHLQKLRNQLAVLTKNSIDNSKKLKNNAGKEELESAMLKYNDEIKVLREKVRNAEQRQKKKMENAKKQYDYIKKLERQLVENGVSMQELEDMKKNNIFNQIYEKLNSDEKGPSQSKVVKNQKKEQIQDMTIDRYVQLKNQAKLYKKLHQDYDKRLQGLQKEKMQQDRKAAQAKRKLQQKQSDIKKLQDEISELKTKMRKNNIKANFTAEKSETKEKSKDKPKPPINKVKNPNQKTLSDQTHLKYDEKGLATEKGVRFTDRAVIGKVSNSRITIVKVWTQKSTFAICGIQCFYKIGDQIKAGTEHISTEAKKSCTQNVMQLADGDFVKNISGHLSQNNIVEYLVLISNNSIIGRFGVAKPTQKQFNFDIDEDEMPICLYGSLISVKDSKRELTYIEQIGFEISRDKNFEKDKQLI